jgi:hypothetical protein
MFTTFKHGKRSNTQVSSIVSYLISFRFCFRLQVRHTHQEILNTLFEGLRRLEYRGYDSAGVSVDWPVQVRLLIQVGRMYRSTSSTNQPPLYSFSLPKSTSLLRIYI